MAYTIFGSAVPTSTDLTDGTDYSLGTRFTTSTAGTVTHGRWYFPATIPHPSTPVQIALYGSAGPTQLGAAAFPLGATLSAWNQVAFSPAIPVAAGTAYAVVVWTPERYVASPAYSFPITSGPLTTDASNGWFTSLGSMTYPTNTFNSSAYFADLVFETLDWTLGIDVRVGG